MFIHSIFIFIFSCIRSSLLCTGFLQLWQAGATLCCGARASHCGGFSCCGAQALGTQTSLAVARRLSSCGSWAQFLCGLEKCGTFPDQGLNPCPLYWQAILNHCATREVPIQYLLNTYFELEQQFSKCGLGNTEGSPRSFQGVYEI